jgi:hypothetical protein
MVRGAVGSKPGSMGIANAASATSPTSFLVDRTSLCVQLEEAVEQLRARGGDLTLLHETALESVDFDARRLVAVCQQVCARERRLLHKSFLLQPVCLPTPHVAVSEVGHARPPRHTCRVPPALVQQAPPLPPPLLKAGWS